MPRAAKSAKPATPGDVKSQATVDAEARASGQPFTPNVPPTEAVAPTRDTASPSASVKTTAPLRGTLEEQMAALMARQNELEQRNRDLEAQVRSKAEKPEAEKKLPTLAKVMAEVDAGESAEERRPQLSQEGWYVRPDSFEDPNQVAVKLTKVLDRLAA